MEAQVIKLNVPKDVWILCELFDTTPEVLLQQFMNDLCSMPGNGGSDERRMAKEYLLRTYLPHQSEFGIRHAEEVLEDFEMVYHNAYPCVGNPTHEQQRAELLSELFRTWRERKQLFTNQVAK